MGKGIITISLIAVRDMLQLPEEYELLEATYNAHTNTLEILAEHPGIPASEPGTGHIEVRPIYEAEQARVVKLKEVQMIEHRTEIEPVEEAMKKLSIRRRDNGNDRP